MTVTVTAARPSLCALHDAGACGSCPSLGTALPEQLAVKQARVADALRPRIPTGAWLAPCASQPVGFRNKAKMAVAGTASRPTLGILDGAGHGIDLRTCPLHVPAIQRSLPHLARLITEAGLTPYDVPARRGELKHILVTASPDEDLMVRFVLRSHRHLDDLRSALPRLQEDLPQLAVASANIQPIHQAVLEGDEEIILSGQDRLLMRLSLPPTPSGPATGQDTPAAGIELPLYLPTRSFFQTNTPVAQSLYATARHWAGQGRAERVWDLFCGVGGFALALAAPGREILGVESSAPAITGARDAARLMGLPAERVRFEAGDARVLDPAGDEGPDLLVVNPPRRGIGELAQRIEACEVPRLLYSSCNPASLAADLERMPSLRVVRARLFDMFPHTDHAEVLVELART
ncbi:methyltransferase domain-containing protein [Actinomyces capricornis]|uniref:23S rRNA (Uracil(747)-C(5))-methyltransferase RlmC n=1 Tax=Actinomyces capricornis TaxID=2755559 RepID=A0ABM7U9F1_9ACTO|nr:methyltransferase domain-containing protein [Actinomyces capricornis]BDA64026.1 23S rRNA (uracil(747)-C(5))-methyltransferase RlmC [Actinomyces capricornis]